MLAVGTKDGRLRVLDPDSGAALVDDAILGAEVLSVAFSLSGDLLATGLSDRSWAVRDASSGAELLRVQGHDGKCNCSCTFDEDGCMDPDDGCTVVGHDTPVIAVCFSPCGKSVATGGEDDPAQVWDARSGELLPMEVQHQDAGRSVSYSPCGRWMASGEKSSNDGRVLIWDSSSGTPHRTLTGGVNALSFSPDGHSLATGGWDGVVRVWNVESGSVVCEFKGHRAEVLSVCFSPDGSAVASAGADRAVRLMDVAAGTQRCWMQGHSGKDACVCQRYGPASPDCPVEGHRGVVSCVGFSPDGATLASGGDDNTVKIWDAATGALRRSVALGEGSSVLSLAWGADRGLSARADSLEASLAATALSCSACSPSSSSSPPNEASSSSLNPHAEAAAPSTLGAIATARMPPGAVRVGGGNAGLTVACPTPGGTLRHPGPGGMLPTPMPMARYGHGGQLPPGKVFETPR